MTAWISEADNMKEQNTCRRDMPPTRCFIFQKKI